MIQFGISLRTALREAEKMGCRVEKLKRTGEAIVSHPKWINRVRFNVRKKDAPRGMVVRLQKLQKNWMQKISRPVVPAVESTLPENGVHRPVDLLQEVLKLAADHRTFFEWAAEFEERIKKIEVGLAELGRSRLQAFAEDLQALLEKT